MASDVSICSAALMMLGDAPIATLDENTKRAMIVRTIYAQARDDVLRCHPWNCLTVRVLLSPETTVPAFGWTAQFIKPGDCLRVLGVGDEDYGPDDYTTEGSRILANTDALKLVYVARKDEGEWDANLVGLMTRRIQLDLAYPITKSTSLRDTLRQEYYAPRAGALAMAKAADGQENPPELLGQSTFIAVRG